jgi:hypothetical protein
MAASTVRTEQLEPPSRSNDWMKPSGCTWIRSVMEPWDSDCCLGQHASICAVISAAVRLRSESEAAQAGADVAAIIPASPSVVTASPLPISVLLQFVGAARLSLEVAPSRSSLPTKLEIVINLKTAAALGLTIRRRSLLVPTRCLSRRSRPVPLPAALHSTRPIL